MNWLANNALLYRQLISWRKNAGLLSLAAYPLVLLAPLVLVWLVDRYPGPSEAIQRSSWLLLVAHLAYFAIRTLWDTVPWVARERELGSLDAVRSSGIREWEYLWVRLVAVVAGRVVELVVWSPLLLVPVGLHLASFGAMAVLVLATVGLVFFWAALGLCCSAWSANTFRAGQLAYGTLAVMAFGGPLLDLMLGGRFLFSTFSPLVVATAVFWPGTLTLSPWILGLHALGGLPLMLVALAGVRRVTLATGWRRTRTTMAASRFQNPLLYRELAGRPLLREAIPYMLGMTTFLVYGHCVDRFDLRGWFTMAVGLHLCYFTGKALVGAVRSVGRERERKTWECLLSSTLTPQHLYWGKFGAVLLPLLVELALALPAFVWFSSGLVYGWIALAGVTLVTVAWLVFLVAAGIWLSYHLPTAAAATWGSALVAGLVLGGPLLDLVLTGRLLFSHTSPLLALSALMASHVPRPWTALLFATLYGVAAWGVISATLREFRAGARCGLEPLPPYQRRIHLLR